MEIAGIHFYTGIPSATDKPFWNSFWTAKMAVMGTRGIQTFSRSLRYRNQTVALPDGTLTVTLVGQEKGVDVRIALDIVRLALERRYDVALIFSQDQVNGTDWIRIDRPTYDACIDPNDYRPKKSTP